MAARQARDRAQAGARAMRRITIGGWLVVVAGALAGAGCARGEPAEVREERERPAVAARPALPPPPPPAPTATDSAAGRARVAAARDSVQAAFDRVLRLRAREVAELRLDANAEQIAAAESLGVRVGSEAQVERLLREGRLVPLEDSTEHWVLRDMEHSMPYATPDARAMLVQVGRRFHARLDSIGLPRFRFKVTSVLRTGRTQAELRRTNANAARTVSAHEFGTTADVSHERFAVPAAPLGAAPASLRELEVEMLEEVGKENGRALQAELGRAIWELREQGALHVMMEDRQPVYHMTVRRRSDAAR